MDCGRLGQALKRLNAGDTWLRSGHQRGGIGLDSPVRAPCKQSWTGTNWGQALGLVKSQRGSLESYSSASHKKKGLPQATTYPRKAATSEAGTKGLGSEQMNVEKALEGLDQATVGLEGSPLIG